MDYFGDAYFNKALRAEPSFKRHSTVQSDGLRFGKSETGGPVPAELLEARR